MTLREALAHLPENPDWEFCTLLAGAIENLTQELIWRDKNRAKVLLELFEKRGSVSTGEAEIAIWARWVRSPNAFFDPTARLDINAIIEQVLLDMKVEYKRVPVEGKILRYTILDKK